MDEAFPKPSKLLIVTSVAVIALGLWLLGLAIGSLVASLHPCSIMALLIVLPLILAIPVQQYRGTFRRVASAAMMMATLMYVTGVFVAFGGAVAVLEALIDGPEPRWDLVLFFSIWPVIGL